MTSLTSAKEAAGGALTPETPGEYLSEKRSIPLQDVSSLDYDCDSLSDGREKADTTPENLKKIDDVIEQRAAHNVRDDSLRSHFWSHPSVVVIATTATNPINTSTTTTTTTSTTANMMMNINNNSEPVLRVDESERKLDMDKSSSHLRSSTNDSLCKRDHNESATNATTPLAAGSNGSNSSSYNNTSPNNNYDESSIDSTSTTATKQSFAFTIDHFNDKDCDPAAAQAKYKSMLERFQQRHRRGASMSKLENSTSGKETLKSSSSAAALTRTKADCDNSAGGNGAMRPASPTPAGAKVKLRARDRSTSRVRDASKRHSWSPRSSTSELTTASGNTTTTTNTNKTSNSQQSRSTQRQEAMPPPSVRKTNVSAKTKPQSAPMTKTSSSSVTPARQQFTPRSTAMQLALQKVDFMCAQPPLADFKHLHNIEADNISETGTYTLDGDNYTEEQKDLMNIDKSTLERAQKARRAAQAALSRPTDLELTKVPLTTGAVAVAAGSRQNVLEVNYFHEPEAPTPRMATSNDFMLGTNQSASSYLEKIKSRVLRNMTVTKNCVQDLDVSKMIESSSSEKTPPSSADVGTFTSVTTSGVLAKQSALDARPKLTRRSSLSTSQIDSSEYVSNESKLKQSGAAAYAGGGFTDHQKAEYRLNVFTNQKDTQTFSAPNRSFIQTPPDSPAVYKNEPPSTLSDAAVLKTAQNKNDWIQEWARNARARSLASCDGPKTRQHLQTQELMTRSYTCSETGNESLTDDSVFHAQRPPTGFSNKTLASRYRLVSGEFDYASDPALSSSFTAKSNATETTRPPKSPSKIPSPLHSLGRARSASRTRASLQNMLQLEAAEADSYLQKTAAAINNLQQSLSRKNSLQSPVHSGSPRAGRSKKSGSAYYSPDEISPQHSLESPTAGGSYQPAIIRNAHKRNLSMETYNRDARAQMQLMTSSFNEQQLQLLTGGGGGGGGGGDYAHHRQRGRKNSYDGNMQLVLPNSPVTHRSNWGGTQSARGLKIHEQHQPNDPNSMSPLRRSSSFSAKIAGTRAARPQFQNIYTPPAARQNYVPAGVGYHQTVAAPAHGIKKSASSNNFGNVYSDYDENLAYYIKDEDEYIDDVDDDDDGDDGNEYYSSGEELEHEDYRYRHLEPHSAADTRNDASEVSNVPLTNTRLNKALLMRIERSKQKVAGGGGKTAAPSSATSAKTVLGAAAVAGVVACPNTPELPRRNIKSAPRSNAARQSMPRDSSLNRLAGQIPNSLASAKKQLLQTAAASAAPNKSAGSTGRVQPKYLDISKYKPVQGNNFLRKNDAKSTLKPAVAETMKRSPSSSSMGLSRGDATRASNRSAKSATSVMTTSGTTLSGRASSAVRRDASIAKQKEAELAMWKRRSKYDPMKAAAEDRRKKEEAKRMAQTMTTTTTTNLTTNEEFVNESANQTHTFQRQTSCDNQWTLGLREAGDEELSD